MRILIVEDDPAIVRFLERGLAAHGHQSVSADNGQDGVLMAADESVDFVLLDIMLPGMDGQEVLRRIRARRPGVPVLMLTARDEVSNRIRGLDAGADDYLVKPFDFGELLARLRALLRRAPVLLPEEIVVGDLVVDTRAQRVWRAGERIELTAKEYALLEYLARNAGRVVSRADITAHVWDENHDPFTNAIEVYVNRLRRKVDRDGLAPLLATRRGAGYVLAPPEEDRRGDGGR